MRLSDAPLIGRDAIADRVRALAAEISSDYAERDLVLVAVLKGAIHFVSDLQRALTIPATLDFVRARSYAGLSSSGSAEIFSEPTVDLAGRHVLIVEDILDTGVTASAIFTRFGAVNPASLDFCTLLDKPSRRKVEVPVRYTGFTIEDRFVVGYGMDYEERYRGLKDIFVLEGLD